MSRLVEGAVFGFVLMVCAPAGAELRGGMHYGEVMKEKGPPVAKVEYESKRESVWRYADGDVLFREGVVVTREPRRIVALAKAQIEVPVKREVNTANPVSADAINEIIGMLPDEGPGAPTGGIVNSPEGEKLDAEDEP